MCTLEVGQVYEHRDYYLKIVSMSSDSVNYHFFDRQHFYFEPNQRRQKVDNCYLNPIEVTENRNSFGLKLRTKRLKLMDKYFEQNPVVGIVIHRK